MPEPTHDAPARATCMMLVKRTQCGAPTTMGCLCCQVGVDQLAKQEAAHSEGVQT